MNDEDRFLIFAPTGRDALLTAGLLRQAKLANSVVRSMGELCHAFEHGGAAALMIAEEVFAQSGFAPLRELLARQSAWSDLPILVFTSARVRGELPSASQLLASLGNVTFLDRPLRPVTMLSAARAALRARQRQYAARAELDVQQRAVRERDQFLAMLGHELRNPLSAITMALNLDRGGGSDKYREIMRRQTAHLSRLVDDLLDVARVTSGRIVLRKERVDVGALLQRCLAAHAPALALHQSSLQLPKTPVQVEGDPVRLEQVLNNLLDNAIKYTPAGGGIAVALEQQGGEVALRLRDTGVGIGEDMLGRVFDLFTQAERSLDRAKGGMGIGLTLVRTLVELHGGTVEAASGGLNQGTQITVRLPCAAVEHQAVAPAHSGTIASGGYQLLLIEDNDDSRELLATLLGEYGHQVTSASDGVSGVAQALASEPQVMLVDIGLPGLDGYGVAKRVREAYGDAPFLIALTGYGQPEDRARALASGFDAHLTKPVDLKLLESVLSTAHAPQRNAS